MQRIEDLNFEFGASDTTKTIVIADVVGSLQGDSEINEVFAIGINLIVPSFTSNPTWNISMLDNGINELLSKSGYVDGISHYVPLMVPINENTAIKIDLSEAAGGSGGIIQCTLWWE
jgi:hypothetical protein